MQQNEINEKRETEDHFLNFQLRRIISAWPLFLFLFIISMTVAWLYLHYKIPIYETTASILIKDDKKGAGVTDPLEAFDLFSSKKSIENEMEILQSKMLIRNVVENLHLYTPVFLEKKVFNQSAYLLSPIVIEVKKPDSLEESGKIYFSFDDSTRSVKIDNINYPLNKWDTLDGRIVRFLPNKYYQPGIYNKAGNKIFFSFRRVKTIIDNISDLLKVSSSKESTVIDLSIQDEVSRKGEDILNELLKTYNEATILDKNILASNTLKFVENRLKYVVGELDSVESRLQNYKSQNNITDISTQGELFLQRVADNDQKLGDINVQLTVLDQIDAYLKSKESLGGAVPATLGVSDPVLTDLLHKLSDLELEYTKTIKIVPENNPSVIAIADEIRKLKPSILENIESQRKNLTASKNNLIETTGRYSSMLETIPAKERELLGISRQQAIKNNIYTFLLQKREETALSFASAASYSRIVDKPISSDLPVSPKKQLIYLVALLVVPLVGITIIYIRTILRRTIHQPTDISRYSDIPIIAEIGHARLRTANVFERPRNSWVAEQFRQLRTTLEFMAAGKPCKKILVTSGMKGEGKNFVTLNLGISLALMGKKTVLLELDLRNPKLSKYLQVPAEQGISEYLSGTIPGDQLVKTTGLENLYLVSSGEKPANPAELLSNARLQDLLNCLNRNYDYILMELPPVLSTSDAFILSPHCDVSLFVVRYNYTPKLFLQRPGNRNKLDRLTNPLMIYNNIARKEFR